MRPHLVGHLLLPVIEHLLGRRTFAYLRELEASQWWTPDELHALQARKLKNLLSTAVLRCPYYRRIVADHGIDIGEEDPFAALARLPLLDKATIRANLDDITNKGVRGGPRRFTTGGSTGEPLVFYLDRRRIGCDKAARLLTHGWFGAAPGDREVYLWGSPVEVNAQDHAKRLRDYLTNELLLEAFNLSPQSMNYYLTRMHRFDPVSIFGYPSSLSALAQYCEATGQCFEGHRLRAVFVTGELLDARQRQQLQRFFRVPVADCYGSRDGGFIAHECPQGRMHVFDQNVIVEIVDTQGHPLPPGQTGQIVITHLDALATPLLRYRTGDLGSLAEAPCPCGRGMRTMDMLAGRQTDHLVRADGALQHALASIYVIRELSTVRQFQIHQLANRNVEVCIVPARGFQPVHAERIRSGIKKQLGLNIDVSFRIVDHINSAQSGKFRHVVSDASRGGGMLPARRSVREGVL